VGIAPAQDWIFGADIERDAHAVPEMRKPRGQNRSRCCAFLPAGVTILPTLPKLRQQQTKGRLRFPRRRLFSSSRR
jgi:hypothetical protein